MYFYLSIFLIHYIDHFTNPHYKFPFPNFFKYHNHVFYQISNPLDILLHYSNNIFLFHVFNYLIFRGFQVKFQYFCSIFVKKNVKKQNLIILKAINISIEFSLSDLQQIQIVCLYSNLVINPNIKYQFFQVCQLIRKIEYFFMMYCYYSYYSNFYRLVMVYHCFNYKIFNVELYYFRDFIEDPQ